MGHEGALDAILAREEGPAPSPPRQGDIWWSAAPPAEPSDDQAAGQPPGVTDEQLHEWLSMTAGWKALELSWGALQGCAVSHAQLKPLLQAALAEASRLGAPQLVVRQLDVDEVLGRCLALALEAFPAFSTLKLCELNLYDEALGRLSSALHATEHLRTLVLDTVWASASGWGALGSALKVNSSLQVLRMRYCLAGAALPALCGALADQQGELAALQLADNELRDAGVGELCKALTRSCSHPGARPSRVAELELSRNLAGKQCAPGLAAMLRVCKGLRRLDVSYNDLGPEGTRELCRALAYAPHVSSLNLAATGADDSTAEALARSLSFSTAGGGLQVLSLAQNRVTHGGAALLAAAVRRPGCGLTDVDLAGNGQIGEMGAKAWAAVLSAPGARLRRLVLSGCEVPDGGAFALGAALKANSSLRELGLAENHISTSGLGLLAEVVKVNAALQVLDVSCNMVGPQGMLPFSQMSQFQGHVYFSKAHGHRADRAGSCLVKAELLREYRAVEAVKNSQQPWEQERGQRRQEAADFYFSPPSDDNPFVTAAAVYGDRNPFLSPADSYVNPFLSPQPSGGPYVNPFISPAGSYVNPFLSPQPSEPAEAADCGGGAGPVDGPACRTEATRVISKRGDPGAPGSEAGSGGSERGSGGVYVSSCSTADYGDLVTDLDLGMVDHMMESMGLVQEPYPPYLGSAAGEEEPGTNAGPGAAGGAPGVDDAARQPRSPDPSPPPAGHGAGSDAGADGLDGPQCGDPPPHEGAGADEPHQSVAGSTPAGDAPADDAGMGAGAAPHEGPQQPDGGAADAAQAREPASLTGRGGVGPGQQATRPDVSYPEPLLKWSGRSPGRKEPDSREDASP